MGAAVDAEALRYCRQVADSMSGEELARLLERCRA